MFIDCQVLFEELVLLFYSFHSYIYLILQKDFQVFNTQVERIHLIDCQVENLYFILQKDFQVFNTQVVEEVHLVEEEVHMLVVVVVEVLHSSKYTQEEAGELLLVLPAAYHVLLDIEQEAVEADSAK